MCITKIWAKPFYMKDRCLSISVRIIFNIFYNFIEKFHILVSHAFKTGHINLAAGLSRFPFIILTSTIL